MPTYQSPGVYVEEVATGARLLAGVGTAIAALVGLAEAGPFNRLTLVSNWTRFTNTFGDIAMTGSGIQARSRDQAQAVASRAIPVGIPEQHRSSTIPSGRPGDDFDDY